ncbi:hypothetical protein ISU02_18540, partial [Fusibacter sp. Q10-2]|nr:hypothetical protein [Fusibacter ferrireducens]
MKRKLSIFLISVVLINLIIPLDFLEDKDVNPYNKDTNAFDFVTDTPLSSQGVAFRTVGFKAYFTQNGKNYEAYFLSSNHASEEYPKNNTTWVTNYFHVPMCPDNTIQNEGIPSIYEAFEKTYKTSADRVNIAEFFAKKNVLKLDAVFAKVVNTVPQGSISIGANGELIPQGTIWKTKSEFLSSDVNWSLDTREAVEEYYGIPLGFPAQPVGIPEPIINGTVDGIRAIRSEHIFNEGQNIALDAIDSTFPNKSLPLIYKWKYRKVGTSTWTTVIKSSSGTPFKNSLEVGTYEVELSTAAVCFRAWWNTSVEVPSKAPATTRITIVKTLEPLTEATLTSPPEIKLEDNQKLVSVPVTLNNKISNLEQSDILSVELQISTYEKDQKRSQFFYPSLNQTMTHNFSIPYIDDSKTQLFEGKAIVTLKGGGIIESPLAISFTYLYKTNNNLPPVAIIRAPSETMTGNVYISGENSYDLDGHIVSYDFSIPKIGFYQEDTRSFCMPNLKWTGLYQVILGVTDDDGARSETGAFIKVIPTPPNVEISSKDFYKENRKITLKATNLTEFVSPVRENYHWTIVPMDVTNPQSNVKMVSSYGSQIDVLMKVKGKYLVTCTGTNSYGVSDTETKIINVQADEAPVMLLSSEEPHHRDGTRMAKIMVYDHSDSMDGDFIKRRVWSYRFDSDNDGLFTDESSVALKTTEDYTDNQVEFNVGSVGKYEISLAVTETFGQETIPQFITQADYRTGAIKQVITVDNYKPSVSFMGVKEKKIDLKIITDYEGTELLNLEGKLNALVNEGYDQFLNIQYEVISDKKYVGRYLLDGYEGFWLVPDEDTPKYAVAWWPEGLIEYSDNSYTVSYTTRGAWPSDQTYVTESTFPARIRKAAYYGDAALYLLENGDLYFLGTNSYGNGGNHSINCYATSPELVATDVADIQFSRADLGSYKFDDYWSDWPTECVFILKENGDLYVTGRNMSYYTAGQYLSSNNNYLTVPVEDSLVQDGYGGNLMAGGYKDITKVKGISNIDYMYVNERTVVVRTKSGEWYGYGAKLSGFGYPTMLDADVWKIQKPRNDYDFDAINYNWTPLFVRLNNLIELDRDIGGIEKVDFGKAYGKNGKVYHFNLQQFTIFGMYSLTDENKHLDHSTNGVWHGAYFPLQETSPSVFTYSDSGTTWDKDNDKKVNYFNLWKYEPNFVPVYTSDPEEMAKAIAFGVPKTAKWGESNLEYPFPRGAVREGEIYTATALNGPIVDFNEIQAYKAKYRGTWYDYNINSDEDDTYYYHFFSGDLIAVAPIPTRREYVAGWKTYGVDASKIKNTTYRAGSHKYMLYFGENDSFKKVSKDLEAIIKTHNINVKVSAKPEYIDDASINKSTETNLRGILNALPTGKQYPAHSEETIFNAILDENKIQIAPDGGTYVILGEDTISYEKFYRDYENDPKLSENSKVIHEKDYYKNSMGLSAYHNQTLSVPLTTFDKVGKYEIEYRATDKPSTNYRFAQYNRTSDPATLKVYVHRRPIADFDIEYNYRTSSIGINMKNQSYDPDHQGEWGNGIVKSTWTYRKKDDINWTSGTPSTLNYKDAIEIALTVTDLEGATSSKVKSYTM